jgi:hypothetical protein
MAAMLRHAAVAVAALLAVAAVCADSASTFYSSDPNLGSARVVFQVTPYPPDIALLPLRDSPEIRAKRGVFYLFLGELSGSRVLDSPCLLRGWRSWEDLSENYGGRCSCCCKIRSGNWLGADNVAGDWGCVQI